jgi:nucleotide-binding universal stress UspA family protein
MKILIGYDGSDSSDAALDDLRRAGLPRAAEALVVTVGDVLVAPDPSRYEVATHVFAGRRRADVPTITSVRATEALREAKELASRASGRVRTYFPEWQVRAEGLPGTPPWALIQRANELKADLIVVGSQGRSALGRHLLGSVSKAVATNAHCSVEVVR